MENKDKMILVTWMDNKGDNVFTSRIKEEGAIMYMIGMTTAGAVITKIEEVEN